MSLVLLNISVIGLRDRLLLPVDAKIAAAGTVQRFSGGPGEADVLVLAVDLPGAPEGAVSAEAVYHHSGHRDPVEFERFIFRAADGTEVKARDLRRGMTLTAEPPEDAGPEPFRGVVVIEWPARRGPLPHSALPGPACTVTDAVTGKLITTCTAVTVRATMDEIITADLTLLADADGNPVLDGKPVPDPTGREVLTGTFPFAVAEMRVRGKA